MIQQVHSHPDIYRIRVDLPDNPLQYLNAYVIKGVSGNLVIDTGFNRPECKRALCQGLQELDIRLQSDTSLFITHLHADHSGLVGLFAATGCPVYMHPVDYQYLVDSEDGSTWKAAEDNFMREGMPPAEIKTQFSNQARTLSPDPHFPVNPVHDGDCLDMTERCCKLLARERTEHAQLDETDLAAGCAQTSESLRTRDFMNDVTVNVKQRQFAGLLHHHVGVINLFVECFSHGIHLSVRPDGGRSHRPFRAC